MSKFQFTIDENKTSAENTADLEKAHAKWLEGQENKTAAELKAAQEKLTAVEGELKPFKQKARSAHIAILAKGKIADSKLADAIKLAEIADEDDDKAINSKLEAVLEGRDYLKPAPAVPAGDVIETVKTKPKPTVKKRK